MGYKNCEGYSDPTAGLAMAAMEREEMQKLINKNHKLILVIRDMVELAGFEIIGRITLKHKRSGKVFK